MVDVRERGVAGQRIGNHPGDRREAARLGSQHVRVALRHRTRARKTQQQRGSEVRHGAGGKHERILVPKHRGEALLELALSRVLAQAEMQLVCRRGLRGEHRLGRPREKVAAQVDHGRVSS